MLDGGRGVECRGDAVRQGERRSESAESDGAADGGRERQNGGAENGRAAP